MEDTAVGPKSVRPIQVPGRSGEVRNHLGKVVRHWMEESDSVSETEPIYVLYGVAARDSSELVCMFFRSTDELAEFEADLPGNYRTLTLRGVAYDDLVVGA